MHDAQTALRILQDGNRRFVALCAHDDALPGPPPPREALIAGQTPFAVVVGCSDSRVPVETIFQQGFGDLFVVRVAGHVPAAECVESVEYAVSVLGVKLVMVLGHTGCGAVQAALARHDGDTSVALPALMDHLAPVLAGDDANEAEEVRVDRAVEANMRATVARLSERVGSDDVVVTGGVYCLEAGAVTFLDDLI